MRQNLTRAISIDHFKEFYWLKKELQSFCRQYGISATGSKVELAERIETFLRSGEIKEPIRKPRPSSQSKAETQLSLDTIISDDHRCSQHVRAFFKTVIPTFHFSTYIQNYFKSNIGKTYRDAVAAWYQEQERKEDPAYQQEIGPQFEYNQFIRDFFADPKNKGKRHREAIACWSEIKKRPGSNKYSSI
ncbi:hypothetical protein SAMN04488134_103220 [Amphibacillus marinus]|uniref:SAP domain-containing protein n=1 Tax=Amphibacillus marinus TaxID=872970 RepID=A0A1H8LI79_9BACI|nr:DUF6434 domain-containing protein [Amphibacillus marinus]SEO04870.1 hypothetical protein SAMN04488134_103220 [Amphibacillus marinus]